MSQSTHTASPFVEASTLQKGLTEGRKLTVLDARFDLASAEQLHPE